MSFGLKARTSAKYTRTHALAQTQPFTTRHRDAHRMLVVGVAPAPAAWLVRRPGCCHLLLRPPRPPPCLNPHQGLCWHSPLQDGVVVFVFGGKVQAALFESAAMQERVSQVISSLVRGTVRAYHPSHIHITQTPNHKRDPDPPHLAHRVLSP